MLKKISSYRFFIGPKHPLPTFLKEYYGNIIFLPTYCVGKDLLLLPEIHNTNFSFILKFINSSFFLNMNFPFMQSSCFYNNSFLLQKFVSYNHSKRAKAISITRQNVKLRTIFLWFFKVRNMIYDCVGAIRDPLKQDLASKLCRNQKKSLVF